MTCLNILLWSKFPLLKTSTPGRSFSDTVFPNEKNIEYCWQAWVSWFSVQFLAWVAIGDCITWLLETLGRHCTRYFHLHHKVYTLVAFCCCFSFSSWCLLASYVDHLSLCQHLGMCLPTQLSWIPACWYCEAHLSPSWRLLVLWENLMSVSWNLPAVLCDILDLVYSSGQNRVSTRFHGVLGHENVWGCSVYTHMQTPPHTHTHTRHQASRKMSLAAMGSSCHLSQSTLPCS